MPRLTKTICDGAKPAEKPYFVWDAELRGFGLQVLPSGVRSFVVQYRLAGRSHRKTLGRYGVLTVDQARKLALRTLAAVVEGKDPLQEKKKTHISLRSFAQKFLEEYVPALRPNTQREYKRLLFDVILPALGGKDLGKITRADVARLHHEQREHPTQANRALAVLSRLFSVAAKWGYAPEGHNPCRGLERYKEKKRKRYLSGEELRRLGEVLAKYECVYPAQVLAVRLLLLTGCRLNEILTSRWEDVDLEAGILRLREAKTGSREVILGEAALRLLQEADKTSEWVIPGREAGRHLVNLSKFWKRVCEEAQIRNARIHDLRHAHASIAVSRGLYLYVTGTLLGHKQPTTTARYSHLAIDPIRQAANMVSGEIAAALEGKQAEVMELKKHSPS